MRAKGVKFLGEPHLFTDGPLKGLTWIALHGALGMQLELVTAPMAAPAKQTMSERLWDLRKVSAGAQCARLLARALALAAAPVSGLDAAGPFPGFPWPVSGT